MGKEMDNNKKWSWKDRHGNKNTNTGGISGGVYGLAFIGAAIYFIQHATTFWMGVFGILKAIAWPALLIYKALEFFKM